VAAAAGPSNERARAAIGPTVLAVVVALVSGYMAYRSLAFPFRPRLAPLAFSLVTFLLAVGVIVAELLDIRRFQREARGEIVASTDVVPEDIAQTVGTAEARVSRRELMAFGWFAVLALCFFVLGFLVGMTVFMLAMMRIYGRERWGTILIVTAGVMAVIYVLFIRVLGVRVYTGMIGDLIPFLPT
jgi:Kef-type K+ transport system membrane component KefB